MKRNVFFRFFSFFLLMGLLLSSACAGANAPSFSAFSADRNHYSSVDPQEFSSTRGEWDVTGLFLPKIFGDGMILQRDEPIHIYGESVNGSDVEVIFEGKSYTASASAQNGSFVITLPPAPAGYGKELTVKSGGEQITYTDVRIGDVFLCGGQSNMQLTMDDAEWYGDFYSAQFGNYPDDPDIRQLLVQFGGSAVVQNDVITVGWQPVNSRTIPKFAPLAYLTAASLRAKLNIPVGLVMCSAGGSAIQLWMPAEDQVYEGDSDSVFYEQRAVLYNQMLAPVLPYSYAGVLWYQGEANASYDKSGTYRILLDDLIRSWRKNMYNESAPFYIMELAGYSDDRFASLREEQRAVCETFENVFLIPNFDLGSPTDIHPKTKDILAERIVKTYLATRGLQDVPYAVPAVRDIRIRGKEVTLLFDNVYGGLQSDSDHVTGFMLAGSDGVYYDADAVIKGKDKVVVTCAQAAAPLTVRYCFKGYTDKGSLYNSAGMPPYPFRTDSFEFPET